MKKIVSLVLIAVMLLSFTSCMKRAYEFDPKEFTESGMTITLTEGFWVYDEDIGDLLVAYEAKEALVMIMKEEFNTVEGMEDLTEVEYGEFWQTANKDYDMDELATVDGLTQTKYTAEVDGITFVYLNFIFKGPDAFWVFQFASTSANYENYKPYFVEWAKSVKFS